MLNNITTANNTIKVDEHSPLFVILTSIFICIVMLAAVVGNSLVIFCVCYYPRLRGRTNYLIVSLAVADWLVATLSLPFRLAQTVNYEKWPWGQTGCQFWIWVDMLCCAASILSLMAISFDRLIAVVDPLRYEEHMRPRHVYFMIGFTWFFALICASLSQTKWKNEEVILYEPQCAIISKEYVTFVSMAAFFVPLAVVLVNYSVIFRIAMRHAHRLDKENRQLATSYVAEASVDANHNPNTPSEDGRKPSFLRRSLFSFRKDSAKKNGNRSATFSLVKQLKATKTLAVVIGVFCLCWFPFFVIFLTFQYCGSECFRPPHISPTTKSVLLILFVRILPVANSAANPIIYSCFNAEFRKAFKKILAKITNRRPSLDNMNTSFTAVPTTFHKEYESSYT